ncbi:helix-turn-helix domain-containing protein [Govanella unica]|uniref:Helix-turn-helix domain-containing protein n=1 Tax=Govanella unica TaxID=2975056 RepID=A0A9X3Z631_9PROT|nr:helix-turn-helix domain-containing protein [Govania unica]MDA5192514.1 helix-turn-helix domain-containing protein [Govania unica]
MVDGISIYPASLNVTLEIPWGLAEALVSAGPELLQVMAKELAKAKAKAEQTHPVSKLRDRRRPKGHGQWTALAAQADRRVRVLRKAEGLRDGAAISLVARELQLAPSALTALLHVHRRERKEWLQARRTVEIIRLYFQGYSNNQIGQKLRPSVSAGTVQKVVSDSKDIIAFVRGRVRRITAQPVQGESQAAKGGLLKKPSPEAVAQAKADERAERIALHTRWGVQIYRQFRRSSPKGPEERRELLKSLGKQYEVDLVYINWLLGRRLKKVKVYIEQRRLAAVYRLHRRGLTNKKIAIAVGLHDRTVARYVRQARKDGKLQKTPPVMKVQEARYA